MSIRIFYATGPGDLINAHKHWMGGKPDPGQIALTYSGQFADFCKDIDADVYMVGSSSEVGRLLDGKFLVEHFPKPKRGPGAISFHLSQIRYGIGLLRRAVRFKADVAVIHSDSTHFFVLSLFRLAGMRVIPVLHNTLWPAGNWKTSFTRRGIRLLDGLFFRYFAHATLAVAPECLRQVHLLGGKDSKNQLLEIRGQFQREYFAAIPKPSQERRPFRIMFSGRVTQNKGVFDILEIASRINKAEPDSIYWEICGAGPDLDELKRRCEEMQLRNVEIRGHVLAAKMSEVIARSHATIVPTRSNFEEGMARSAVESVLAGRPVITNAVVSALEVLKPACVEAETDNIDSYVERITELVRKPGLYESLCEACSSVAEPFYDRERGLAAGLKRALPEVSSASPG